MYSTYDDARARERELLQLARKHTIGPSGPRRERRPLLRLNTTKFLTALRKYYAAVCQPAVGHAS